MIKLSEVVIDKNVVVPFNNTAKKQLTSLLKSSAVSQPMGEENVSDVSPQRLLYDLFQLVLEGLVKSKEIASFLGSEKLKTDLGMDVYKAFQDAAPDVFWILDQENSVYASFSAPSGDSSSKIDGNIQEEMKNEKNRRLRMTFLITECASQRFALLDKLKERIELPTLEASGILSSHVQFNRQIVRTKTKLLFKQQKFNLLREESEGYGKLIAVLYDSEGNSEGCDVRSDWESFGKERGRVMLENIQSLIGYFDLDPNRVLDIILEVFETNPKRWATYIPLIRSYMTQHSALCNILGFKFQSYLDQQKSSGVVEGGESEMEMKEGDVQEDRLGSGDGDGPVQEDLMAKTVGCDGLYRITALMIKEKLLSLEDIYPRLSPSDKELKAMLAQRMNEAKIEAKKIGIVDLSSNSEEDSKRKEAEKQALLESKQEANRAFDKANQKLRLCKALLDVNCWSAANILFDYVPLAGEHLLCFCCLALV